jgi:hypothetical protein
MQTVHILQLDIVGTDLLPNEGFLQGNPYLLPNEGLTRPSSGAFSHEIRRVPTRRHCCTAHTSLQDRAYTKPQYQPSHNIPEIVGVWHHLYEGREGDDSYGGEFQTQQEGRRGRDKKARKGVWQEVDCGRKEDVTRRRGKGCGKK